MADSAPLSSDTAAQARMHAGRHARRRELVGMLLGAVESTQHGVESDRDRLLLRLASKVTDCGQHQTAYQDEATGELVWSQARCNSRICPTCGRLRADVLRSKLAPIVKGMDTPRMMTLTLRASSEPLADQLSRLQACWSKLRRSKPGKKAISGGLYVIEITYNARADQWHPHLHVVFEGGFWRQADLADQWERITGDSRIVDIRMVHGAARVANYVTKYVSKSQTPTNAPGRRLAEWCEATHGQRMAQTFGTCHGAKLTRERPEGGRPLAHLAPITPLVEAAEQGDEYAAMLVDRLKAAKSIKPAEPGQPLSPAVREALDSLAESVRAWWKAEQDRRSGVPVQQQHPPPKEPPPPLLF